jgi:hypothetical protein
VEEALAELGGRPLGRHAGRAGLLLVDPPAAFEVRSIALSAHSVET